MPRNTQNIYQLPPNTYGISGQTISSVQYNILLDDLTLELNSARPISAGGTGATNAAAARASLSVPSLDQFNTLSGEVTGGDFPSLSVGGNDVFHAGNEPVISNVTGLQTALNSKMDLPAVGDLIPSGGVIRVNNVDFTNVTATLQALPAALPSANFQEGDIFPAIGQTVTQGGHFSFNGVPHQNLTGANWERPASWPETEIPNVSSRIAEPTPPNVIVLLGQSWATPPPPADIDPEGLTLSDGVTPAIIWEHDGIDPLIGPNFSAASYGAAKEYVDRYDRPVYVIGAQVGGSSFGQNGPDYVEPANPANNARHIYPSLAANWAALKARLGYTPEILAVFVRTGAGDESTLKNPFIRSLTYLKTIQDLRVLYEDPELTFVFQTSYQGVADLPYGDFFAPEGLPLGSAANPERQSVAIFDFVRQFDQNSMILKNAGVDGIISHDDDPPIPDPAFIYDESTAANAALAVAALAEGETFQMAGRVYQKQTGVVASTSAPFDVPYDNVVEAADALHQSRRRETINGQSMMKGKLGDLSQLAPPSTQIWYIADRSDNEVQKIRTVNDARAVVGINSPKINNVPVVQHIELPSPRSHRGGSIFIMTRNAQDLAQVSIQKTFNKQLPPPGLQASEFENDQMEDLNGVDTIQISGPTLWEFTASPSRNNYFVRKILNHGRFIFFEDKNIRVDYTTADVTASDDLLFKNIPMSDNLMDQGRLDAIISGRVVNNANPVEIVINMKKLNDAGNFANSEMKQTVHEGEWFAFSHSYYMSKGDEIDIRVEHDETDAFTVRNVNLIVNERP